MLDSKAVQNTRWYLLSALCFLAAAVIVLHSVVTHTSWETPVFTLWALGFGLDKLGDYVKWRTDNAKRSVVGQV